MDRVFVYEKTHHTLANYMKRMTALVVSIVQKTKNGEERIG